MTGFQIYALASPLIVLAFGLGVAWWSHYSALRSRREAAASTPRPAE